MAFLRKAWVVRSTPIVDPNPPYAVTYTRHLPAVEEFDFFDQGDTDPDLEVRFWFRPELTDDSDAFDLATAYFNSLL